MLIDSHSHIYDSAFDLDQDQIVAAAQQAGVEKILLPAIDSETHEAMFALANRHVGYCIPMMGLHPTSVNDNANYKQELDLVKKYLDNPSLGGVDRFCAVGEIGLDLYWSKEWQREQTEAFTAQIEMSLKYDLPLMIHTRDAWVEMRAVIESYRGRGLRGVMHAFSGTLDDYRAIKECGDFLFGIGGVSTYKNSEIAQIIPLMKLEDLVLETDAPYLTPVPMRGKRNESAYIKYVAMKVAELMSKPIDEVAQITTLSAKKMFQL